MRYLWASPLLCAAAFAAADTNVTALVGIGEDTYDAVLPIALGIAGTLLAFAIGVKVWKRFVRV